MFHHLANHDRDHEKENLGLDHEVVKIGIPIPVLSHQSASIQDQDLVKDPTLVDLDHPRLK
jgi:hypothetical protein